MEVTARRIRLRRVPVGIFWGEVVLCKYIYMFICVVYDCMMQEYALIASAGGLSSNEIDMLSFHPSLVRRVSLYCLFLRLRCLLPSPFL